MVPYYFGYFNHGKIFTTTAILSANITGLLGLMTSANKMAAVAEISLGLKYPLDFLLFLWIVIHFEGVKSQV